MSILEQTPTTTAVLVDEHGLTPRGPIAIAWTFLQRQPVGAIGMVLVLIFGLAGIFAEWIAPYSPTANDFARHVSTATLLLQRRTILDLAARRG